jgi:predicted ATPase
MTSTRPIAGEFSQAVTSPLWPRCEERIRQFEQAWQQGQTPEIGRYLLQDSQVRRALLVVLIQVDMEFRFKLGAGVPVEDYLEAYPELAEDDAVVLDLLAEEYRLRTWKQEPVEFSDLARRFPQLRHVIFERLSMQVQDTQAATPARPPAYGPLPAVPGYEVLAQIGRGGMGIVYKARQPVLDRHVALKFLPLEYARSSDRLQRFLHEARTASSLNHPNICTVHALDEHEGRPFLVMEFVEGDTLQELARRRPGLEQIVAWLRQVSRALAAAHAAGVVHRDVKPENIMVRDDGYVKVLDFGLARRLPRLDAGGSPAPDTQSGAIMGTVAYMSPEQTRGANADPASDIFSLGVVAYQLLSGVHPFDAGSPYAILSAIAASPVVPLARHNPAIPVTLASLVEAMLHKDPRLRPAAAEVEAALEGLPQTSARQAAGTAPLRPIVRREVELAFLRKALRAADEGQGSFVCIAGEPGIGKTTLVEDFLAEVAAGPGRCLVARGNCSELLADSEAYLPAIDALENLLRSEPSGAAARLMRVVAPAWYSQLGPSVRGGWDEDAAEPRASSKGALLREFVNFLQEAARLGTIVLFFDDVHWSDHATVDLLAHVGRQCRSLRLLVIVTYRPTEILLGFHPFRRTKLQLQARGECTERRLAFLGRHDVARYLDLAYPNHAFPIELAEQIHVRTEGSPLFMAAMLEYLSERGVLAQVDGTWRAVRELPDFSRELPESIRGAIDRKIEQLDDEARRLLAAASVQGQEFDSAVVADALGRSGAEVEERLQTLARVHGLVRPLREQVFPEGTFSQRYRFVHALYRHALCDNLPPTRRAAIASALAAALEKHQGREGSVAAELACLYETGRDFPRAARQFHLAAQNAARVFAHREAIALARRGLAQVARMPASDERTELELEIQTTLGLQLQVTEGYAAPTAEEAYRRARDLCRGSSTPFPVLWGLWLCHKVRSELGLAQETAGELLQRARQLKQPDLALQAHQALGMTAFCRGELARALEHTEQVAALYDPNHHHTHAYLFGHDPAVISRAYGAVVLWLMGHADAAQQQSAEAIQMSRALSPTSQAMALHFAAMVHQLRRDVRRTFEYAEACAALGGEHGLSFWRAGGTVLSGWALAAGDQGQEGLARLRRGLSDWRATGSITYETYYLGLLAEVLAAQQQSDESQHLLDQALALSDRTGEGFWVAELYRLRGENCLLCGRMPADVQRAEADFRQALHMARQQGAASLELRAAESLAKLAR